MKTAILKRMLRKILTTILDKPLAMPSAHEEEFLAELRAAFRSLKPMTESPAEPFWARNMELLRELILNDNPREFLRWDVISDTMFVGNTPFVLTELKYLKRRADWNTRWRNAIKESPVGHPVPFIFCRNSSGNLISHAYHVAKFEESTGLQVDEMEWVFEFGGGYGSMCRLFFNLGFRGKYIIYDLPPISALQTYFLKTNDIPIVSRNTALKSQASVVCASDIGHLRTVFEEHHSFRKTMFIATWSISESPMALRNEILSLVSGLNSFLIAYQDRFGGINNLDFFDDWKKANNRVTWDSWRINHIPGNTYLVGKTAD